MSERGKKTRRRGAQRLGAAVFTVVGFAASPALAEDGPLVPAPETTDADRIARARQYYERCFGSWGYDDNLAAALVCFERMYELAPNYKLLYNIGRIRREMKEHAAALRSYTRYLREGGDAIPAERRAEVERELVELRTHVAELAIRVNVDGANVYVDDMPACMYSLDPTSCVGVSPLQGRVLVDVGFHTIGATKKQWIPAKSSLSVPAEATEVSLTLVDARPRPRPNPWTTATVIGWSATGAAAILAGVTVALALSSKEDMPALAYTSVSAAIGAGLLAGASTYFTYRLRGWRDTAPAVDVALSPLGVRGSF